MFSIRRVAAVSLPVALALVATAVDVQAQEANFVVLSAYAEDAAGAPALQAGKTINLVLIANNQGEAAARNARVRVELRSSTVAFMNEPGQRSTDVVLGDFGARISQQVFVPVVATERTASIDIVVTPLWDGQRGAPAPQTHRFPTGFATAGTPAPNISTGVPGGVPPVVAPSIGTPSGDSRRDAPPRAAPGTRLTRAQLAAQPVNSARMLRASQVASGTLDRRGLLLNNGTAVDLWYYEGTAGENVTITLESPSLDTYLMLNRLGSARELASDDDGAGSLNSRITMRLPETGTYVVIANALGARATGTYTLSLLSDRPASIAATPSVPSAPKGAGVGIGTPGGSLASAGRPLTVPEVLAYPLDESRVVRMGATVNGRLTTNDPKLSDNTAFHAYYFNGFQGDRVSITMRSSAFDAYLHFGQLGGAASIATDDDTGGGTNARVTVTLPATGTYVILANVLSGGAVGAYTLEVRSP